MREIIKVVNDIPKEKRALLINKIHNYKIEQEKNNHSFSQSELELQYRNTLAEENFCYEFMKPGDFKAISFRKIPIKLLEPDEVQIKAKALSLNFRDLMIGLGIYPSMPNMPCNMGSDYSGVVIKCGSRVNEFKPGDEVIALHKGEINNVSHFNSYINVPYLSVVHKPVHMNFEEAATIPTVFLAAYYGLYYQAHLSKGEQVLIHSATGGVGLAAIQVAKWCGAEILATAGNVEKRDYLTSIGVLHTMNSRSLDFADEVLKITKEKGVDVILNSLPGKALEKGLEILKCLGRFIQIEKGSVYENSKLELGVFKKGLTFSMIDIVLFLENPKLLKKLLSELMHLFNKGDFQPLPYNDFPIWKVGDALSHMSKAKHIGKIVLSFT